MRLTSEEDVGFLGAPSGALSERRPTEKGAADRNVRHARTMMAGPETDPPYEDFEISPVSDCNVISLPISLA